MNFSSPQRLFSNSFFQELVELRAIKLPLCFSVLSKDLYDSMINAHHHMHSFVKTSFCNQILDLVWVDLWFTVGQRCAVQASAEVPWKQVWLFHDFSAVAEKSVKRGIDSAATKQQKWALYLLFFYTFSCSHLGFWSANFLEVKYMYTF